MVGNGFHDPQPPRITIHRVNLRKCLVNVGQGGDKGSAFGNRPDSCLLVERISPAVVVVTGATSLLKDLKKMNGSPIMRVFSAHSREKSKAHGVVRVCNRETLWLPKQPSRRRQKCLTKHHRSHRRSAEERPAIVQRLCASPERAGKKTL